MTIRHVQLDFCYLCTDVPYSATRQLPHSCFIWLLFIFGPAYSCWFSNRLGGLPVFASAGCLQALTSSCMDCVCFPMQTYMQQLEWCINYAHKMTVSTFIPWFSLAGDVYDRARRLQEKMRTNLVMARDRLDVLGMHDKDFPVLMNINKCCIQTRVGFASCVVRFRWHLVVPRYQLSWLLLALLFLFCGFVFCCILPL